jgi:outer membrane protein assembly factor BamD
LITRLGVLAFLLIVFSSSSDALQNVHQIADQTTPDPKSALPEGETAERNIVIARFYLKKRDYTGAINRCKVVVIYFPTSEYADEALAFLVESFIAVHIPGEWQTAANRKQAQTAAAVLRRKFPNSGWSRIASEILKSAGLEPDEDEASWISRALR